MIRSQSPDPTKAIDKLSPSRMVDQTEENQFFICKICTKVVVEPKECSNCENVFCSDCLVDWQKTGRKYCPISCQQYSYQKIHRFANAALAKLQFTCEQPHCQEPPMEYELAQKHLTTCAFVEQQCKGCGHKMMGNEVEEHKTLCIAAHVTCQHCQEESYYNDDTKIHDCVANLKEKIRKLTVAAKPINLAMMQTITHCNNNHTLKKLFKQIPSYYNGTPQCDICKTGRLQLFDFYYHCQACQFDLCHACSLKPTINNTQRVKTHNHPVSRVQSHNNGWACDMSNHQDGCYSGITGFHQSQNMHRWRCGECDFDMCLYCCLVHRQND